MKLSEVTVQTAIEKAKEDVTDVDIVSDFTAFLAGAKSFILSYTGLTLDEADTREDLTIALFVLINEMHDNRAYSNSGYGRGDRVNPVVKTILDMHSVNLL